MTASAPPVSVHEKADPSLSPSEDKPSATVTNFQAVAQYNGPVSLEKLDEGAKLMLEFEGRLNNVTEDEYTRIRKRIDWHLLPLMMALYWIQFGDKTSLGNSTILDIKADNNLDQNRFNQCSSFCESASLCSSHRRPLRLALLTFAVLAHANPCHPLSLYLLPRV